MLNKVCGVAMVTSHPPMWSQVKEWVFIGLDTTGGVSVAETCQPPMRKLTNICDGRLGFCTSGSFDKLKLKKIIQVSSINDTARHCDVLFFETPTWDYLASIPVKVFGEKDQEL